MRYCMASTKGNGEMASLVESKEKQRELTNQSLRNSEFSMKEKLKFGRAEIHPPVSNWHLRCDKFRTAVAVRLGMRVVALWRKDLANMAGLD